MLPGITQVEYGQLVNTPDGPGFINLILKYEDGVIGYGVFFLVRHPRWGDSIGYTARQLRHLNPHTHFPETKREIWRPAHGCIRRPKFEKGADR